MLIACKFKWRKMKDMASRSEKTKKKLRIEMKIIGRNIPKDKD